MALAAGLAMPSPVLSAPVHSTPANEPKMEVERVNVADVMEDAGDDKQKEE